ncbi:MAG: PEGA domain-containing protein [Myxococcales bacterium]|jgi:hypothetical protein
MRTIIYFLIWGLLLSAWTVPAWAQGGTAREHFRRGEAAYQKGNYALAISEWETAYSQDQRPRIQYNIYQAHERLGQLTKAVAALQRYLSSADPDDPYYADATARMASLQQRLQATGIRLVGGPDGALINISGHDWGRLPRPDKIAVQPGSHRIVVSLEGYDDFVANVVVPAGQVVDVPIQLDPLPEGQSAPATHEQPAASPADPANGGTPTRDEDSSAAGFYVAAGILGAGAIGSGVWALNRISELDGCDDEETFSCPEQSAVETQRNIAFGLTGVLAAGAIGTLIYGLVSDDGGSTAAACVPTGVGASCRVSF